VLFIHSFIYLFVIAIYITVHNDCWMVKCNQKREGSRSHSALTACTTPSAHVFPDLLHEVHTFESHNTQTPYWLSQTSIARPEIYKCFALTPLQHRIHTSTRQGNSFITSYTHCPKAQAWSPSNAHKSSNFRFCLVSLSLESLYSSSTSQQAQRKNSSIQPSSSSN
jgi:hypothetical protein